MVTDLTVSGLTQHLMQGILVAHAVFWFDGITFQV